ncbi:hypothetical protein RCL_jg5919.t1 [Rhizophagus clarus]|uniref:Uncharacterized protein n=1 Tax=Rhizophagus clarus TaxID=94130 RepID=A0A8H3LWX2_9GLOM|nr:hypothetical protein RCL_jg5919.t1 [Rhizophagus clarus]
MLVILRMLIFLAWELLVNLFDGNKFLNRLYLLLHALTASQSIPTPLDISSGISSYFSNTEFEAWGYMGCLEYLAKVCVHLTSEDQDEILDKYRNHLRSISSSTSTLKRAKDKASKLIDTQGLVNATENLVNAKENLYESKLKARAYDRYIENTDEDDRSSKRPRQETIISEEDKKQPDANTIPKADDDNFDERKDDNEDKDT